MNLYILKLRYLNTYQGFEFNMDGIGYKRIDGEFRVVESEKSGVDESFIMFFENYFTPYLNRVTYNDIVFSDESVLEVYKIKDEDVSAIIHKISWASPEESEYLHIIVVDGEDLTIKYLSFEEGLNELEKLGLDFAANLWT